MRTIHYLNQSNYRLRHSRQFKRDFIPTLCILIGRILCFCYTSVSGHFNGCEGCSNICSKGLFRSSDVWSSCFLNPNSFSV